MGNQMKTLVLKQEPIWKVVGRFDFERTDGKICNAEFEEFFVAEPTKEFIVDRFLEYRFNSRNVIQYLSLDVIVYEVYTHPMLFESIYIPAFDASYDLLETSLDI